MSHIHIRHIFSDSPCRSCLEHSKERIVRISYIKDIPNPNGLSCLCVHSQSELLIVQRYIGSIFGRCTNNKVWRDGAKGKPRNACNVSGDMRSNVDTDKHLSDSERHLLDLLHQLKVSCLSYISITPDELRDVSFSCDVWLRMIEHC